MDTQTPEPESRAGGLLAWQRALYPGNHSERRNLVLHVFAVPLFLAGNVTLVLGPFLFAHRWLSLFGLVAMALAMAVQGRGHAGEAVAPVPFRGPLDVVLRIFVEQWITFPRFLLSGELARAYRNASRRE